MYTLINTDNREITELIDINNTPNEIKLYPNEIIKNINADRIDLGINSKFLAHKQDEFIIPSDFKNYVSDVNFVDITDNIKGIQEKNLIKPKKILFLLTSMKHDEQFKNIQYSTTTELNLFKHLAQDGLLIIRLIDFNDAFGRYYQLDNIQTYYFKKYVFKLLETYNLKQKDLIFEGGSKGGSSAIYLSSFFEKVEVVAMMPQFTYSRYFGDQHGRYNMYFLDKGLEKLNFTQYITNKNNYNFYIGTYDSKSHQNEHNKILYDNQLKNINWYFVNAGHEVQHYFKYHLTYQLDKLLNDYQLKKYNDFNLKSYIQNNELYYSCENLRKFENRVICLLEIKFADKIIHFHLEYKKEDDYCYIKNGKIDLNLFFTQEELLKHTNIIIRNLFFEIETKTMYISNTSQVLVNESKNLEKYQTINIKDNFEILICQQNHHLFLFEAVIRNINFISNENAYVVIEAETQTYTVPAFFQKRQYCYKIMLNKRQPVIINPKIFKIKCVIVGVDKSYFAEFKIEN